MKQMVNYERETEPPDIDMDTEEEEAYTSDDEIEAQGEDGKEESEDHIMNTFSAHDDSDPNVSQASS